MFYLRLPLIFLKFWFWGAPKGLFSFFASLNNAFLQLFSLPLLLKTYFKPWKNEYRQGLVVFSVGMGMFIKTFVILAETILLIALLVFELSLVLAFLLLPIIAVWILFI